jgi:hypothetical protein
MNFPMVIKLRSSDTRKLEIYTTYNISNNKILKLASNQSSNIEIKIKIDKNLYINEEESNLGVRGVSTGIGSQNITNYNNSSQLNIINLYINFSSELFEIKYPIELHLNKRGEENNINKINKNSQNHSNNSSPDLKSNNYHIKTSLLQNNINLSNIKNLDEMELSQGQDNIQKEKIYNKNEK